MALNRSTIVKTPGKVVFDPTNADAALRIPLYSSEGITWEVQETLVNLPNLIFGGNSQIVTARLAVAKIKPTNFTAAALTKVFTHQPAYTTRPGGSIIGSADKLVDIVTMDGQARRMACGFIYGEPAMTCEIGKTILGEITIYGIIGLDGDSAELDDLLTLQEQAWSDADYNASHMLTPGWGFSWPITGTASEWDDIQTLGGVTITPKSELTEMVDNRKGLRDVTIQGYGLDVTANCFNISEAMVRTARFGNGTQALGTQKTGLGRDIKLNAVGGGAFIRAKGCILQPNTFTGNATDTVVNTLTWMTNPAASRTHLVVSTTDPDA